MHDQYLDKLADDIMSLIERRETVRAEYRDPWYRADK